MAKKKPTQYVQITAECQAHGRFEVQKKPNNNKAALSSGMPASMVGLYQAVKCPKCPWWATIIDQKMVEVEPEKRVAPQADLYKGGSNG